jgi:phage terminase small subunit
VSRRAIDPKRALFVAAFIQPGKTLTDAAREAGYMPGSSDATIKRFAKRLAKEPKVAAMIQRSLEVAMRRRGVTLDRMLDHIAKIAYANMGDYGELLFSDDPERVLAELPPDLATAIEAFEVEREPDRIEQDAKGKSTVVRGKKRVKLKLRSNLEAARMLATHWGMRTGRTLAIVNPDGRGGPLPDRQALRSALADLSPDQLQQLEAICETVERAEDVRSRTPLIEQQPAAAPAAEEEPSDGE